MVSPLLVTSCFVNMKATDLGIFMLSIFHAGTFHAETIGYNAVPF